MNSVIVGAQAKGAALCPKFDQCSAPICPLEATWWRAQHLPGDRICLWLREAVKPDGLARISRAATADIAGTVAEALPAIFACSSDIRHKLAAAARSGSKLDNMRALRGRQRLPATSISVGAGTSGTALCNEPPSDIVAVGP